MSLVLNEEQRMLQQSARDFLASRAPVSQLRALRDAGSREGFDRGTWQEIAGLGWPAIVVPEAFGGLAFGFTGLGLVLQETGRTLTASPLLSSGMMGVAALLAAGNPRQQQKLLPAVASGAHLLALAVDESPQHDPARVEARAERGANGFRLRGHKRSVIDGAVADTLIVSARTAPADGGTAGISLFLLPRDTAGATLTRHEALDIGVVADLELADAAVPESALLGALHGGLAPLEHALDAGRIGQSAEALGLALEVFERTLAYLRDRRQFGVPIGSFQALQHRAAMLHGDLELCRSLVLDALHALDAGSPQLAEVASRTKAKVSATAMQAAAEAIQMHGGIGMTDDVEIGFFYKRARLLETLLGDRYYHLDRFARLRSY